MLGLTSGQLQLVPYEPNWSLLFLAENERLCANLGDYILDVQHIGSTSIPGMPAKPILDIGVAVANFEEAARCIPLLEQLGYKYKGENGIPLRHYFVKGDPRTHHLHMLEIESEEWKHHLLFRDYLRANAASAQAYANLKQMLATQFADDREAYQNGKENFIQAVLLQASENH
ncbi:MAG TPA: GrpB family protein [Blastocatellia bacterium]|nr:GrpB family protein [Blastocatellia bacterium]